MSEQNRHNDPIEDLFQKKANEFDIPFREEDWLKLEKDLELLDLRLAYRRKMRWLTAAAILIISLLGYFTYDNHNRLNRVTELLEEEQTPGISPRIQQEFPDPGTPGAREQQGESELFAGQAEGEGEIVEATEPESVSADRPEETSEEQTRENARVVADAGIERKGLAAELFYPDGTEDGGLMERLEAVTARTGFYSEPLRKVFDSLKWVDAENSTLYADAGEQEQNIEGAGSRSRFTIRAGLSPDISTAGSVSGFQNPGYAAGIGGEYRFNENLSLTGGVVVANVRYLASGREYRPSGYWNTGVTPDETSAVCLILDIPVGIKYRFRHFNRSRFFVAGALSSYIMLDEKYRFGYEEGSYGLEQELRIKNGTRHWLSNAGISIGYELDLRQNWTLGVEPYLKLPLTEVGWGNVKLYSVGSFVSLNYKF